MRMKAVIARTLGRESAPIAREAAAAASSSTLRMHQCIACKDPCVTLTGRRKQVKRKVTAAAALILAAFTITAQEKKAPQKGGILHPEMAVENGTWDKPMAKIGAKPDQAWTQTTTAAGVNSQPQPGKPITLVGEIVDFSCYIQLGKHGEKHRSCGQKC